MDTVLAVRPLSVVPEGDEFIVGDADSGVYVVLPEVGVRTLELLRSGRSLGEVAEALAGEVDVADFAATLLELGFAEPAAPGAAPDIAGEAARSRLRPLFSPAAWSVYAACAVAALALFALRPGLWPRSSDMFFLDTPVRSLAALTAITYALAAAHEGCHWLAARAAGVSARI